MRVIEVQQPSGPEQLTLSERPTPVPDAGEVLIKVAAAGLNRADILQRKGAYPPPPGASDLLGLEVSGHVAAVGPGVDRWSVGDAVCALLPGGGYAEYCIAHAGSCLPIPSNIDLVEAAALPEAVFTVWANLFEPRRLKAGESLLVHGGSSGIGTMAIQLARAEGARVITTAGSHEKCDFCTALGCEGAFNYRSDDWESEAKSWSAGKGVDVILDMVGGDYFHKHLRLLAPQGRLVHIAFSRGREVTVDLSAVMSKRLTITGSTLRPRSAEEKAQLARPIEGRVWPLIASGTIRPIVDRVYDLEQVAAAHARMESSEHIGKILLRL
jgi:NADPH2:quinone reductase